MNNTTISEIRDFHCFMGVGGGKAGFGDARPHIPGLHGHYRYIGGIDVDPRAIRTADRLFPRGLASTVMDGFSRDQYIAFHGHEPPAGWREATPEDVRRAAHWLYPNVIFLSAPCKGFSGLTPESRARSAKYQALNHLAERAMWLMLEAWADDPPEFFLFENVPRIATRGREMLDRISALLQHYGYVDRETTHDCGEIGALHQSRKRFLKVSRHTAKVPNHLYEPLKRPLRPVGELLERLALPGDPAAGPMHRVPRLNWKTWVRLAFVEAGKDWRSLNRLAVENGHLRDFLIVPSDSEAWHRNVLGVNAWSNPAPTITGNARATTGRFSVADPRAPSGAAQYQQYGVLRWSEPTGAVIGVKSPGQGTYSVADPRHAGPAKHSNEYRIVPWDGAAGAVTSAHGTGQCVADPRSGTGFGGKGKYLVTPFDAPSGTVIAASTTGQGAFAVSDPRCSNWHAGASRQKLKVTPWESAAGCVTGSQHAASGALVVADPRPGLQRDRGDHYLTAGHYGVQRWDGPTLAVSGSACHDNGFWSVADPRLPAATDQLVAIIRSMDGTWHRPFTTLELAALQGLYDPDDERILEMDSGSDSAAREHIGNMVPRQAARAIAEEIGRAILLARTGNTFQLSDTPVWVRPVAAAISVAGGPV